MARKRSAKETSSVPAPVAGESLRAEGKREVTRSPGFVSIYANDVQIQTSPWDMRLVFGEIGDFLSTANVPTVNIRQLGELRISPQLAKRLTAIILQQLQAYEETIGQIPVVNQD